MLIIKTNSWWCVNSYLIKAKEHNFLIDTGCGDKDGKELLDYINSLNDHKPLIVINSHNHFDHVWGNSVFKECTIIAQRNCYDIYRKDFENVKEEFKQLIAGNVYYCPPNFLINEEYYFTNDKILLIPSLGHTIDGLIIYDEEDKVLYAGDNIGDTPTEVLPVLECSKEDYRAAIIRMKELDVKLLVSGHNKIQTKEFLDQILNKLNEE